MISGIKQSTKKRLPVPGNQQQAIIDAVEQGNRNILVRARAGVGKTTTNIMCLPHMQGDVFFGAFGVGIKDDINEKIQEYGMNLGNNITVKTIHAVGLGAYKYGGGSLKTRVEKHKMHHILDELAAKDPIFLEYESFINKLVSFGKLAGIGVFNDIEDEDEWLRIMEHYSVDDELPDKTWDKYGNNGDLQEHITEEILPRVYTVYRESLRRCKEEITFDDMLLAPLYYNCRFKQYDWVIIDEAQDMSAIRVEIALRMIKPNTGRILVTGDDRQFIMGFSGVMVGVLDDLKTRLNMVEYPLNITQRCPKVVVTGVQRYVPDFTAADDAPQGIIRYVDLDSKPCLICGGSGKAGDVGQLRKAEELNICPTCRGKGKSDSFWDEIGGLTAEDVILCRNNKPVITLAYHLIRKGVPCQVEGRDFATGLIKLLDRWPKIKNLNAMESKLQEFVANEAAKWRKKKNEERAAAVEDKVETLLALLDGVRSQGKTLVSELSMKISEMFGDTQPGQKPKVLTLSTCHKFKGKEAERVYLLGQNRYMPSKWAKKPHDLLSEENLIYVAWTRTKRELVHINVEK